MEGKFCCADCYVKACRTSSEEKYPEFCPTKNLDPEVLEEVLQEYGDEETRKLTVTSACLESEEQNFDAICSYHSIFCAIS